MTYNQNNLPFQLIGRKYDHSQIMQLQSILIFAAIFQIIPGLFEVKLIYGSRFHCLLAKYLHNKKVQPHHLFSSI